MWTDYLKNSNDKKKKKKILNPYLGFCYLELTNKDILFAFNLNIIYI